jgi:pimeloyl-ACP methyl ester carboxylesterase
MTNTSLYKSPAGEKAVMALYDRVLAQWAMPYETMTLPTRHGDTFVIACGNKDALPLILLHGAGTNSAIWAQDAAEYGKYYRVYAVDLLGEAGRSSPNRPAWDSPAYAEWLEDVLDALHIEKVSLLGISQGGWTVLKFAVYQPERIARLVLMCPGGVVPDKASFLLWAIGLSFLGKWGMKKLVRMLYGRQPVPAGVEEVVTLMLSHFKGRIGTLPIFTDEELRRLTMPVLLLGGDEDVLRDLAKIAARLHQLIPHTETTIIPGAGHVLPDLTARVLAFLLASEPSSAPQPA